MNTMDNKRRKVLSEDTRDWVDLHFDLLVLVLRKIYSVQDYFAFRGVCSTWRSLAIYQEDYNCIRRLPCILDTKNNYLEYFNPLAQVDAAISEEDDIWEEEEKGEEIDYCVGCKGWILVVHKNGLVGGANMHLMHIMSGTRINLPPLQFNSKNIHLGYGIINKMVLSSSPLTNPLDYTLMVAYEFGWMMAYWRPGDETFTHILSDKVSDLICYNGLFYSINNFGATLQVIDGSLNSTERHSVLPSDIKRWVYAVTYLVESNGDLLLVVRWNGEVDKYCLETVEAQVFFSVYKIDHTPDGKSCRVSGEMKSLGNRAIFVGGSSASFSVNACEIPGCKPNHIYFTGEIIKPLGRRIRKEKHHMGVYSLSDGLMEYWGCDKCKFWCTCFRPPLWVTPTLV